MCVCVCMCVCVLCLFVGQCSSIILYKYYCVHDHVVLCTWLYCHGTSPSLLLKYSLNSCLVSAADFEYLLLILIKLLAMLIALQSPN